MFECNKIKRTRSSAKSRCPDSIAHGVMLSELNKFHNFVRVYLSTYLSICTLFLTAYAFIYHVFTLRCPVFVGNRTTAPKVYGCMSTDELMYVQYVRGV